MKRFLLLLAFATIALTVEAQDEFTFGKISKSELLKCDYPISDNADVVVLDEYVRIMPSLLDIQAFVNDGEPTPMILREVVARKVKILAEDVAENGKIQIPLKNISDTERENCEPHSVWAQCYSLKNGRIVKYKLDVGSVKRYKQADGSAFLEFEIPNVQQGSIVEYGYTKAVVTEKFDYQYSIQEGVDKLNSRCEVAIKEQYAYLFNVAAMGDVVSVNKEDKKSLSNMAYSASTQQAGRALSGVAEYNGPSLANSNHSRSSADVGLFTLYVFNAKDLFSAQGTPKNAGVKITLKR